MTFQLDCMTGQLADALNAANSVTNHGLKIPVLKSTMIKVGKSSAQLAATNTDHSIRVTIAAEGKGEVFVDTATILQKANALRKDQPVSIKGDGKFLTISQGKTRYRVPVLDGEGFPVGFTESIPGDPVKLPARPFFAALANTSAIVNPDISHIMGLGILLDMTDGFRAVAAQKRGVSVVQIDAPQIANDIIVPLETIRAMSSVFKDAETLDVVVTENAICVSHDGTIYRSKLIEGKYVDWRRGVTAQTKDIDATVNLDLAEFSAAMKRATAIADDAVKGSSVTAMRFDFADGECTMTAKNRTGEEGVDTCAYAGDSGSITLGIVSITNFLATLNAKRISIQFSTTQPESGVMIAPEQSGGLDDFRIAMQMRAVV